MIKAQKDTVRHLMGEREGISLRSTSCCLIICLALALFLLFLPLSSYASQLIYTIQTGSFTNVARAHERFDSITQQLNEEELDYLRIEKVGEFYSIRLGKFETRDAADKFLKAIKPQLSKAIILEAYIKEERIVRLYKGSLLAEESRVEEEPLPIPVAEEVKPEVSAEEISVKEEPVPSNVPQADPYASDDYELYIARGIEKLNEKKYVEATELLRKALELAPQNSEAAYYAAVAFSRLGKLEQAEKLFLKILKEDESATNVNFELGRIYYFKTDCTNAEDYLSRYISYSEDESLKSYASSLMEDCREAGKVAPVTKPFRLSITAGSQYDDNVIVEPTNPPVPADRQSDTRAIIFLTSGATLFKTEATRLSLDYNFYQSLHIHLNDFNVHYHKISPNFEITAFNVLKPSIGYSREYIYFGGDIYAKIHKFYAKVNVKENKNLSTDAIYEYSYNKYWDSDLFQTNSIRRGTKNSVGLKQYFTLNKLSGNISYFYDDKQARETYWSYIGHRAGATLTYKIISPLRIRVSAEYSRRRHSDIFPSFQDSRVDRMQVYAVRLTYMLSNRMGISFMDSYTNNDSNLSIYDYTRNIRGVLLKIALL